MKSRKPAPNISRYSKNVYTLRALNEWQYHQISKFEHIYCTNIMIQISLDIWELIRLQKLLCEIFIGQKWGRILENTYRRVILVKGTNQVINNKLDFSTL